jgi:hypothetical protein
VPRRPTAPSRPWTNWSARSDPDLGYRLLLQILSTCDAPITEARRDRCKVIAERLGYSNDHIDGWLPVERS